MKVKVDMNMVNLALLVVILILVVYCCLNRNNEGYSPFDLRACTKDYKGNWCVGKFNVSEQEPDVKQKKGNEQIKNLQNEIAELQKKKDLEVGDNININCINDAKQAAGLCDDYSCKRIPDMTAEEITKFNTELFNSCE